MQTGNASGERSLKIEQQMRKYKAQEVKIKYLNWVWKTISYNSFKKVKESKLESKTRQIDFNARKGLRYHLSRVWSWLRMNAGGVPNTFKSNGDGTSVPDQWRTGE